MSFSLTEALDALERQAMAAAYTAFAATCKNAVEAAFGAFVAGLLIETGIAQHNAHLIPQTGVGNMFRASVLTNAKGATAPITALLPEMYKDAAGKQRRRSFVARRVSHSIPSNPASVTINSTVDTAQLGQRMLRSNVKDFRMGFGTHRRASDEAHIAAYLEENELDDIDILALHAAKQAQKMAQVMPAEYTRRMQAVHVNTKLISAIGK